MNIFVLDNDIVACAQAHCDRHVVKMTLECAQLLSTTCRLEGLEAGYRATHPNHPSALWARSSLANYLWLLGLGLALAEEYTFRYGKRHRSAEVMAALPVPGLPDIGQTPFVQVLPERYRRDNAVLAYRTYYLEEKHSFATWTRRPPPPWWRTSPAS